MIKKHLIANICMVVAIIVAIVCGIAVVYNVQGRFNNNTEDSALVISEKTGIAIIERNGIAYEVREGMVVRESDVLYTQNTSALQIGDAEKSQISLDGNSEINIKTIGEVLDVELLQGEIFVDARGMSDVSVLSGDTKVIIEDSVLSVSAHEDLCMVHVYAGSVSLENAEETVIAKAGQEVTLSNVSGLAEITDLSVSSLGNARIQQLLNCNIDASFCFTVAELATVGTEQEGEYVWKPEEDSLCCTLEIRCNTILDNMDSLTVGKEGYVPSDGIILETLEVAFQKGESVFDVLTRVCDDMGIQIEYSYTPIYESYYVEGINHLYEFDCGDQSGWMYKVNGQFPNYGCSGYEVSHNDEIVWIYTCEGLGIDVGAKMGE